MTALAAQQHLADVPSFDTTTTTSALPAPATTLPVTTATTVATVSTVAPTTLLATTTTLKTFGG